MPRPVLKLEPPYTPEMLPNAYGHIEAVLGDGADVFEYGSGHSTLWFAERVRRVVFAEHDPQWYEETDRALRAEQVVSRTKGLLVDEAGLAKAIEHYGEFDLVLVDCLDRCRVDAVAEAIEHVRPGGYLVLDDSQWPMLQPARQALDALGWEETVYSGDHTRHTGQVRFHQTSIYQRPAGADEEE